MQSWKTLEQHTLLESGRWLSVERRRIELPDGRVIDDWTWVKLPAYVNIAAITQEGKWLCFRQTKYAVQGLSLAPAGGYIEPDEDPLLAAQRELGEETGCTASQWTALGQYAVDGNRGAGIAHLYLAQGAVKTRQIHRDDLEEQELLLLDQEEVESALRAGAFKVLPWAAVMALALLHLRQGGA